MVACLVQYELWRARNRISAEEIFLVKRFEKGTKSHSGVHPSCAEQTHRRDTEVSVAEHIPL